MQAPPPFTGSISADLLCLFSYLRHVEWNDSHYAAFLRALSNDTVADQCDPILLYDREKDILQNDQP